MCIRDSVVIDKLKRYDIAIDNNRELLITRKININGRSIYRMNGQVVTTSIIKDVSSNLIDIHGQHEHQSLLNKKNYLSLLDTFCGQDIIKLKNSLRDKYSRYTELSSKINNIMLDEQTRRKEISFLEFEINEIESANLKIGEYELLKEEYKRLFNGDKIIKTMSQVYSCVNGNNTNITGSMDYIGQGVRNLSEIKDFGEDIENLYKQILNIEIILSDFSRDLNDYIDKFELDNEYYIEVEDRINLINNLKVKYGDTIEKILEYKSEKEKYLDELLNYEKYYNNVNKKIVQLQNEIEIYCEQISNIRKEKANHISMMIMDALKNINLLNTNFVIQINKKQKFNITGWDDIEFLISTNIGEPPKPLNKVASGGELSRIMLAIKSVLANSDNINTLIFDEIDTGISGKTAGMVAEKLSHLSNKHQVICITHLPQIAAMGDAHFIIEKKVENNSTHTLINKLTNENSINEIARLLGGVQITDTTLANANEMKKLANEIKCNNNA
jgi:DNA repair protein RecN (Recombination protein N)